MIQVIQFLQDNPTIIRLLQQEKVSLIGMSETESKAVVEAFQHRETTAESFFWC